MKKHITFIEVLIVLSLIVLLVKAGSYYRKSSKEGFDKQNSIDFRKNNTDKEEFAEIFQSSDKQETVKKARKVIKPEEVKIAHCKIVSYDNPEAVLADGTFKNLHIKKGWKLNTADDPNFPRVFPAIKVIVMAEFRDINNKTLIEIRKIHQLKFDNGNIDLKITKYLDI